MDNDVLKIATDHQNYWIDSALKEKLRIQKWQKRIEEQSSRDLPTNDLQKFLNSSIKLLLLDLEGLEIWRNFLKNQSQKEKT